MSACILRWSAAALCAATIGAATGESTYGSFGNLPVPLGGGARALGMGGAFSAVADDATASSWNPAGLTQCERPELGASLGWWRLQSQAGNERAQRQTVRPEHIGFMFPFFVAGCSHVVGAAWQRQYDYTRDLTFRRSFSSGDGFILLEGGGASDYNRQGALSSLGLCYAIEPAPGLSLGVTVNQWGDRLTRASSFRDHWRDVDSVDITFTGFPTFTETIDYTTHRDTRVLRGTSWVLGLMWQALPALTVAVVAKPAFHVDLEVETRQRLIRDDGFGTITDDRIFRSEETRLHHPPSATIGLAWRHDDTDTVTIDATWTRWRQYYLDESFGRFSPISNVVSPDDFRDLWTLRAGFEHVAILPRMILVPRIGAVVEWLPAVAPIAIELAAFNSSATTDLWVGASAGFSLVQRHVIWDAAIEVRHGNDVGAGELTSPDATADVTTTTARLGVTVPF